MKKTEILHRLKILMFLLLTLQVSAVLANELNTLGPLYPIAEEDLLQVLKEQIASQHDLLQRKWNFQEAMDHPTEVEGLSPTLRPHTSFIDLSLVVPELKAGLREDSKDSLKGNSKGSINYPITSDSQEASFPIFLHQALLFYNADDIEQVKWAKNLDQTLHGNDKLILVGGSVLSQIKLFHKPVYFDQQGQLTSRFNIHQVPAFITQEGNYLKIEELLP